MHTFFFPVLTPFLFFLFLQGVRLGEETGSLVALSGLELGEGRVFRDRVSQCSSGWPGTSFVFLADLKLRRFACFYLLIGLKASLSTPNFIFPTVLRLHLVFQQFCCDTLGMNFLVSLILKVFSTF